jgi:CRISPR-associated endonuclease/helicase Cas3
VVSSISLPSFTFSLFQRFGRVNRRAKKDFSTYNCFVFTEIQGNAHYFVDDTIHALSKQAVLNVDGVISEEEKKKLIDNYLSTEKIVQSKYYDEYCKNLKRYEDNFDYLELKKDGIRRIDRSDAIPAEVFDQNESVINDALKVLNSESVSPVEKLKASETILGFTVSVNQFRIDNNNTGKFIDMKYNKLPIIECIYDSECGIRFDKKKKTPKQEKEELGEKEEPDNFL